MIIQKSRSANPLVVHTDKLKMYLGDTPGTWLTDGGGGSEDESTGTPIRTESSGTRATITLNGANNSVPSVQIGTTDREPNLLNSSEDESPLSSALGSRGKDRPTRQRRPPVYLKDYVHELTFARICSSSKKSARDVAYECLLCRPKSIVRHYLCQYRYLVTAKPRDFTLPHGGELEQFRFLQPSVPTDEALFQAKYRSYYKQRDGDGTSGLDPDVGAKLEVPGSPLSPEANVAPVLLVRAADTEAVAPTQPKVRTTKRKKAAEPKVSSTLVPSRPAWNFPPILIGYSQPVLAGMVAGLTRDITTFGGEEYAELDTHLAFRNPEIDHYLRQALTLGHPARRPEATFYAALVRGTAAGSRDPRRSHRDTDAQLACLQEGYGVFWAGGAQRPSDTSSVVGSGGSWSGTAIGDTEEMMILDELPSDLGPASSGGAEPSASDGKKKKKLSQKMESVGGDTLIHIGVQVAVVAIHQAVPVLHCAVCYYEEHSELELGISPPTSPRRRQSEERTASLRRSCSALVARDIVNLTARSCDVAEAEEELYIDVPETDKHAVCGYFSPYDIEDFGSSAYADDASRDDGQTPEAHKPAADISELETDYDESARRAAQRDVAVSDSGAGAICPTSTACEIAPRTAGQGGDTADDHRGEAARRAASANPPTTADFGGSTPLGSQSCGASAHRRERIHRRVSRRLDRLGRTLHRVSPEHRRYPELLVAGAVPVVFSSGTFAVLGT